MIFFGGGALPSFRKGNRIWPLHGRIDQAELDGKMDQFGGRVEIQFFHDIRPVGFDRTDADTEHIGNVFRVVSFADQLQHLPLAVGQLIVSLGHGRAFTVG